MKLTEARRRGFEVLVGRPARRSNETCGGFGYIYWQTADWLVDEGLAVFTGDRNHLLLTRKGEELAKELGVR